LTVKIDREAHDDDGRSKPDGETDSRIARSTLAVLDRVRADLVGTPFTAMVADDLAGVIERADRSARLASKLEQEVALFAHRSDPFVETFVDLSVAVAPISDPRSGQRVGVVALMCRVEAASELMLSYVRRVGREMEDGLVDHASAAERALTAHFVRVRRHVRGAIVCVNERTMLTNAAAARLVDEADRSTLWEWAQQTIARGETKAEELVLSRGIAATVRCEPVEAAGENVGVLIRLNAGSHMAAGTRGVRGNKRVRRETFGWASLSAAQLGIAELVARGLTNGEIAARLYLSRHTVDFHLRQIFSKLSIESRVELARIVSEHASDEREAS
jgi:DNA-binding CsgD family transcriptional regulator